MTPNFLLLLPLLLHPPGVPGEAVQHSLECSDDKPTTLCLAKSYSTFDLPLRQKENMVEIGNIYHRPGVSGFPQPAHLHKDKHGHYNLWLRNF